MNSNERNYINVGSLNEGAYKNPSEIEKRRALYAFTSPNYNIDQETANHLDLEQEERTLDIGCGEGIFLGYSALMYPSNQFVGLDISSGMFESNISRYGKNVNFLKGDAQELAFKDSTFDRVIAMHMLYHVPNISNAIREMARVLKPNGKCLVTANSVDSKPMKRELKKEVASLLSRDDYPDPSDRFNIEIGEGILRGFFRNIQLISYESTLTLNDSEAYVDYFDSLRQFWNPLPSDIEWQEALELVENRIRIIIDRDGKFEEQNKFGIFVCSDPEKSNL